MANRGLRIYDTEGNILSDYTDRLGRLIHSQVVASGTSDVITLSDFFGVSTSLAEKMVETVEIWLSGDYYAYPQTYPGIIDHLYMEYTYESLTGDYYAYWYNVLGPEEIDEFIDYVEMVIGQPVVSGTSVATVSGANQTRWETLYNASISGTHPYDTTNVPYNLNDISVNLDFYGFDNTEFNNELDDYELFTPPFTGADGYEQLSYLGSMYYAIIDEIPYNNTSTDDLFVYTKALSASSVPHEVSLSVSGTSLLINYSAREFKIGKLLFGIPSGYMYSGDSIVYLVGYK